MRQFLDRFRITTKLNATFTTIVVLVVGLVGFSVFSISKLQATFSEYRDTAAESAVLGNLNEDFLEARLAVMKYRTVGGAENEKAVYSNIDEIVNRREEIDQAIRSDAALQEILALEPQVIEYRDTFRKAVTLQNQENVQRETISAYGRDARKRLTEIMESAYEDNDVVAAYYAARSQQNLMLARYYSNAYLENNLAEDAERALQELARAEKETGTLLSELQNPVRRDLANKVLTNLRQFKDDFIAVRELVNAKNALYFEGLDVIGPQVLAAYDRQFTEVREAQKILGPRAAANMARIETISIIAGIVIAVLAGALAVFFSRFMTKNFKLIIRQMKDLSEGDTSFEIEGTEREDEIGDMGKALQVFKDNTIKREELEERARKEQEEQMEKAENMLKTVSEFEDMIEKVSSSLNNQSQSIQSLSTQLTSAMEETTAQSASVASASQQASTNVQTVASAAEELSASIKEISRNVSDTSETAKQCASSAQRSQGKLKDLQDAVSDIDSVIQAINDVAEQTNLLALNATIEAARAGEAGKGFAVVANEVKTLAGETHKMTEEIAAKVEDIKSSATETITSVTTILEQITSVDNKTSSVAAAIEQQNSSTEEISRNVQEAAQGTDDVSRNIEDVQRAANDSAASTEQLKSASDELAQQSAHLKKSVEAFLREVRAA